jgi:hypothetical protein
MTTMVLGLSTIEVSCGSTGKVMMVHAALVPAFLDHRSR